MQSWWENTEKESEGGIGVNNCEGGIDVNNCGGGIDVNNSLLGSRILFVLASSANRKQKPYIKRLAKITPFVLRLLHTACSTVALLAIFALYFNAKCSNLY